MPAISGATAASNPSIAHPGTDTRMSLVAELKRRNVFRVAAAYVVAGWLLTEVLTTVLPTLGAPAWTERAVVLVFAFGFVPAVVFAWLFELTPDGLRRQRDVDADMAPPPPSSRRLEYLTLTAVVLGVLFLAFFGSQPAPDTTSASGPPPTSVAVLPFQNMSGNPDNEYFSNGLTETLLHMLAQIPELKVAARTSSFAFKDEDRPIGEIARALGVAHVLEGSVQRDGDRIRVSAQLIRAEDGFHVWSAQYNRELDDIFRIQDAIAGEVSDALSQSLLGPAEAGLAAGLNTESADAYDLYLQALGERATFSYWGLQAEEDLLKGALTIDPEFIAAKNALAFNYLNQVQTGLMSERDAFEQVAALTDQVLEVRPHDAHARAIDLFLGTASQSAAFSAGELEARIDRLEALVAEHPDNLEARLLLIKLLKNTHRVDRAEVVVAEGLKDDSLNPQLLLELAAIHVGQRDWNKAESVLRRSLAIEARQPNVYALLATIRLQEGDGVGYVRNLLSAIEVDPADYELSAALADFLYDLGLVEEADDFRNRVRSIAPTSAVAIQVEMSRGLATGDTAAVTDAARRAIENDIANRRDAFVDAVTQLLHQGIRDDRSEETLAWIAERRPGIFATDEPAVPLKFLGAQLAAFDAWYVELPPGELVARLDQFLARARSFGLDPADDPTIRFTVLALRGDVAAARKLALEEILTGSVLPHLGWQRYVEQAQYAEVIADDRVQARFERWREEEAQVRESVRSYLGDLREATG